MGGWEERLEMTLRNDKEKLRPLALRRRECEPQQPPLPRVVGRGTRSERRLRCSRERCLGCIVRAGDDDDGEAGLRASQGSARQVRKPHRGGRGGGPGPHGWMASLGCLSPARSAACSGPLQMCARVIAQHLAPMPL